MFFPLTIPCAPDPHAQSNKSREGLRFSTNRLQRLLARCNSSTTTTSSPPRRNARDVFLSSDESPEDVEEEEEDSAEPPQQPIAGQLQTSSGSPFAEEQDQYLPPSAPATRAGLEQDEGRGGDRRAEEEEEMETDGSDGDLDALLASMSPEERRRQMVGPQLLPQHTRVHAFSHLHTPGTRIPSLAQHMRTDAFSHPHSLGTESHQMALVAGSLLYAEGSDCRRFCWSSSSNCEVG